MCAHNSGTGNFQQVDSSLRRILVLAAFIFTLTARGDWPAWRGPTRDGHASPTEKIITQLPAEPKVLWRIKIGEGLASPVVAGSSVVYFDAVEGKETIHLLDKISHEEKWRTPIDIAAHDTQGPDGPRNTPMIDQDRIYAVSCRGQLDCLALADGKKLWGASFTNDFGALFIGEKGNAPGAQRHGNNSTPLIVGDFLYGCVGGTNGASVVCFDKRTGKVIWKSQDDPAGYAPPALATLAGAEQLVCFTADGLIGLNPSSGQLDWRFPIKTAFARHVTAPVWDGDVVVVSSHQAGMFGVKIASENKIFKAEQAWISKENAMNFSSPVAVGHHLYGLGSRKNFECVEIATGKQVWSREGYIQTSADRAYAGFLVLGKNILCLTDTGQLVLFEANPEKFHEIGQAQVCGANWCNPAYDSGRLYLRDGNKGAGDLICLDLSE